MNTSSDEQAIRELLDRWVKGACTKDLDTIMSCYEPRVRAFDAISKLQFRGVESYREHWAYCLGLFEGEMQFEIHDPEIAVRDDIAFTHFLATCGCPDENGQMETGWLRGTVCLKRTDGQWRIVHEHYSVPLDPETMKALEKPEP